MLALSKYIYYNESPNYRLEYNYEESVSDWVLHEDMESGEIQKIINDFDKGFIPDAFCLMIDYFC